MYVYYITMEIYVLGYKNIFSSFYCLCIISMHTIFLLWTTHKQHQNLSKLQSRFPSQFYFIKLYIHITISFYQMKMFSKGHKHSFIYYSKKNLKKNPKVYTSYKIFKRKLNTWLPMWFHIKYLKTN
jgi:hypothetical protein